MPIAAISSNRRVAKNTFFLYLRMFLIMIVQLYTVPIVLKNLGVSDYGIFSVVGGIVTMFSFIGTSLTSGAQRFLAFSLGKGDDKELKQVFDTTILVFVILGLIAVLLLEVIGVWFLNNKMNFPEGRLVAANWIFQFSIISFFINLISIPYNSAVIAHEKMNIFAYVSIVECIIKLGIAFLIQYAFIDRLIFYGLLMMLSSLIMRLVYQVYCVRNFGECRHLSKRWDKDLGISLITYSGYNVIGSVALILRSQGVNIVMNLFFGTLLNAAHSLAASIQGLLSQLVSNVYMASRPQITKSFATGDKEGMWDLVYRSSRWSYYLLLLLCVPAFFEIDTIIGLWLDTVPEWTSTITKLMIISLLVESLFNQVIAVFQAENKIKTYQISSSTILLLNIPLSYLFLKMIPEVPMIPYIVSVVLSVVYGVSILVTAKKEVGLDLFRYFKYVVARALIILFIAMIATFLVSSFLPSSVIYSLVVILCSIFISLLLIYALGLDEKEKSYLRNVLSSKLSKFQK